MSNLISPFLLGGGQMGELTRQKDWSKTLVGTPDQWPISLQTTVSILLKAKLPMLLWWGEESTQFFNDAYCASLDTEEPAFWLGMPGPKCWKQNWPAIETKLRSVSQSGEGSIPEDISINICQDGHMGKVIWRCTYNPILDDSGKNQGILLICTGTTQHVLEQNKVEATNLQILSVFEQSPVALAIYSKDQLVFQMANTFFGHLVGRKPQELIGRPLFEALPELAGQGFEHLLDQVFETEEPYVGKQVQVELLRNGRLDTFYVDLTYQPLRGADGTISEIFVVATDVTLQVLSRREIEDSERILRNMILNAPVGICLLNANDMISETVNDSFIEVSGKTYEQIIGKNHWLPFAEVRQHYETALNNVAKNGVAYFANEVAMMLVRHGKQEQIYVTFAYIPLIDTSGKVKKIVVWVLENTYQVTERKKVEEIVKQRTRELSVANDQLSESNELLANSNDNLERFTYVASHDLQEPLRKIQQFASLLKQEFSEDNGRPAMLVDKMQSATERMSILIRDLLDFSKISHQRSAAMPVSLDQIVGQVLITLEQVIIESKAMVTVDALPQILAVPMQIEQLFQNLLSNAIKFRKAAQPPVIGIHLHKINFQDLPSNVIPPRQSPQYYCISVTDNGIGFDEQYTSRIFQMFQRLHGRSEFAGTGIGLAIAEKVVTNHGGALIARSQPGIGSTFYVYLPIT